MTQETISHIIVTRWYGVDESPVFLGCVKLSTTIVKEIDNIVREKFGKHAEWEFVDFMDYSNENT